MARTTSSDVQNIMDTDVSTTKIDAIIEDANALVTDILGDDTTLSTAQLTTIEKWLTAHFIAIGLDQQAQAEGTGDAKITYQGKTGMGLDATYYGQQVKVFDTTGKMAQHIGKKQASIYAIESFDD